MFFIWWWWWWVACLLLKEKRRHHPASTSHTDQNYHFTKNTPNGGDICFHETAIVGTWAWLNAISSISLWYGLSQKIWISLRRHSHTGWYGKTQYAFNKLSFLAVVFQSLYGIKWSVLSITWSMIERGKHWRDNRCMNISRAFKISTMLELLACKRLTYATGHDEWMRTWWTLLGGSNMLLSRKIGLKSMISFGEFTTGVC